MGTSSIEFARIERGEAIVVDGPHGLNLAGIVEDVAPDGSVLWVREDGGHGRRMVHVTDGATVQRQHTGE
ncbi:hypothetical protein [Sinomonas sp. ASV322]|uniref:hypothetical protein n=1 Tax=Sinomonas sp. ASV322 TaxID=3041920 RepID=UPI0027DC5287|nr:hypothetical protein [Sinomonas sp. ASV322]MDQ4503720.1 hypothetical protein [Sinomonas sp. ASV322]